MEISNLLYLSAIVIGLYSLALMAQLIRIASTKQSYSSVLPLISFLFLAATPILSAQIKEAELNMFYIMASSSFLLLSWFSHELTKKKINLPKNQLSISITSGLVLAIAQTTQIPEDYKYSITAFAGILSSVMLILYCERIYHVIKSTGKGHGALPFSMTIAGIFFFAIFSNLIVTSTPSNHYGIWASVVALMSLPFLIKGCNALSDIHVSMSISRPLALHTALFSIAGFYLLGLSGLGVLTQSVIPDWSYTSQAVMVGALVFPVLYLLSSNKLRREILVWLNKHLYSAQFDYRDTWRTIHEKFDPELEGSDAALRALKTVSGIINHPYGAYYRIKGSSLFEEANIRSSLSEANLDRIQKIMSKSGNENWIIDVNEACLHPERYPMLNGEDVQFRAEGIHIIIPVVVENSLRGVWVVMNGAKPKWKLNWETRDFLTSLGQQMEGYIHIQSARQSFQEAAQLAAFHQTSAFVIHDMKNVYAQLAMLNKNAQKHGENPEFIKDAFASLSSMQIRMEKMLGQLTNKQRSEDEIKTTLTFDLAAFIKRSKSILTIEKFGIKPEVLFDDNNESAQLSLNIDKLTNVLRHLVDNALYACKNSVTKKVTIICNANKKNVIISIIDTGSGMSADFVKAKLFKPFETTKGNAGMGLGVYDAKNFIEQIGGEITVRSEVNKGTEIALIIPRSG
jgi:putative PEP-CTERM system histidine kinase